MIKKTTLTESFGNTAGQAPVSAVGGWVRPKEVTLIQGDTEATTWLRYEYDTQPVELNIKPEMLKEFIALAPDEIPNYWKPTAFNPQVAQAVVSFARKWGSLIGTKEGAISIATQPDLTTNTLEGMLQHMSSKDRLDVWRSCARTAKDILMSAKELHANEEKRCAALKVLDEWLLLSVVVVTEWNDGLQIRLKAITLKAALAFQLATVIARHEGIGLCGRCGDQFDIEGQRKKYCKACGKNGPLRNASRTYYLRKKKALTLWRNGKSTDQIAKQVGRPVEQVNGWIEDFQKNGSRADRLRAKN
jgi:transposase-like protein